jgi:hypothetical protein
MNTIEGKELIRSREDIKLAVNGATCIPWEEESWANYANDYMWKFHLYIFVAMLSREVAEAYSLSIFSVRVLVLITIPIYLVQVVISGYALRGGTRRYNGWMNRWNVANKDKPNPCFIEFGNARDWLWVEILILYINVLYLVLVLVFNRLKNADNKVKAIIKTFK